jgi:2-polyprenyl-6-methoxyphenol hydroxylase-like FAD-dependent oxidoreductase
MPRQNAFSTSVDVPVLVIGGGPAGLTLAMDLGWRGIPVLLLEQRSQQRPDNPKCNTTNARSMEHFRRLGCAEHIRAAGLPAEYPTDVVYLTAWTGNELARVHLPSSSMRHQATGSLDEGWPTPEPQHRISQLFLEPILAEHLRTFPGVTLRYGWKVEAIDNEHDQVVVHAVEVDTGRRERITARFAVGCDGGRSATRTAIGSRLEGDEMLNKTVSVHFRSRDLIEQDRREPAWMHWIVNPHGLSNTVALDGKEHWLVHIIVLPGRDFDDVDIDAAMRAAYGWEIDREILGVERWVSRRMVANRYRSGNVFLAGDAAHIWMPMGGFGMNAAIGDATHLAWILSALLHGWGSDGLLDAYEAERKPVGALVSRSAVDIAMAIFAWAPVAMDPRIDEESETGEELRQRVREVITRVQFREFNSVGVQLGYYYEASPIVCYDDEPPPEFVFDRYTPTSRPGSRAPHLWLADGTSLYDRLGKDFTLLRLGPTPSTTASLEAAAADRGVPLTVLDVPDKEALQLYGHPLVLVRPDQHIAWRGTSVPGDPFSIIDRVRGAAAPIPREAYTPVEER